jgi:hypothetical protein
MLKFLLEVSQAEIAAFPEPIRVYIGSAISKINEECMLIYKSSLLLFSILKLYKII